jgi:hypothetical protein
MLVVHVWFGLLPAYRAAKGATDGRDFASYYYAFKVAADGGDPYDTGALDRLARAEHTRRRVHPFFYPPPFLLTVALAAKLTLKQGFLLTLALNELLLGACAWLGVRAFGVAPWAMALIVGLYSPLFDHLAMGQANLLTLVPLLAGLALVPRRAWLGGALVGLAAMLKMSPALMLAYLVVKRRFTAVLAALVTAVGLSLATLPLVGFAAQRRFYFEVLPSFSSGEYHGLSMPIGMTSNHSVPHFFNTLWRGPDPHHLSPAAAHATNAVSVLLFALWAARARRGTRDPDPSAIGALMVLMTVLPVFTYEHHLVLLLLPLGVALTTRFGPVALVVAFFLGWPLAWQRAAESEWPFFRGLLVESKLIAALALFALNLFAPGMGAKSFSRLLERLRGAK